jgi:hypothetical protein
MRKVRIFVASSTPSLSLARDLVALLNPQTVAVPVITPGDLTGAADSLAGAVRVPSVSGTTPAASSRSGELPSGMAATERPGVVAPAPPGREYPNSEEGVLIEAICWENAFSPALYTLDNLILEAKLCDFAAIILTGDDASEKRGVSGWLPRDNCIYEAGLFTGALGPSYQRCFLLSSVETKDLPTDVLGLTYLPLVKKDSKITPESLQEAATKIRRSILDRGPLERTLLGADQLIERESHVSPNTLIYISAAEPLESEPDFAERVMTNMKRSVEYRYFFHDDPDIAQTIAGMIQALAAVGVEKEASEDTPLKRRDRMMSKVDTVKENLEVLRRCLAIHLHSQKPTDPCCIHNAGSDAPTCYFRFPCEGEPSFVAWKKGDTAKEVARKLRALRPSQRLSQRRILSLRKASVEQIGAIADYLSEFFPEKLWQDVFKVCFDSDARAKINPEGAGQ